MSDITAKRHLNPVRPDPSYPGVVKRARHNSYRVKRRTDVGIRHDRPVTIQLANAIPLALTA
jgi:hypothetical protein